ncbi:hypothetical protein [Salidesulfovibrio onnuriiensis]|uniref:hypothetical protein n=1 Tax=Salidesulfovibrio onnuriiensis TaxID=2583823 RepID=UPI0011C70919|nr:hypothetical protein [Salidesulfovibrio onnuriiensis]
MKKVFFAVLLLMMLAGYGCAPTVCPPLPEPKAYISTQPPKVRIAGVLIQEPRGMKSNDSGMPGNDLRAAMAAGQKNNYYTQVKTIVADALSKADGSDKTAPVYSVRVTISALRPGHVSLLSLKTEALFAADYELIDAKTGASVASGSYKNVVDFELGECSTNCITQAPGVEALHRAISRCTEDFIKDISKANLASAPTQKAHIDGTLMDIFANSGNDSRISGRDFDAIAQNLWLLGNIKFIVPNKAFLKIHKGKLFTHSPDNEYTIEIIAHDYEYDNGFFTTDFFYEAENIIYRNGVKVGSFMFSTKEYDDLKPEEAFKIHSGKIVEYLKAFKI